MKNKIILVGGYCATGKTTFSDKLAQEINIPCFHKDAVKETLAEGFGHESEEILAKGNPVTFMLMLHITECFLQAGKVCILESNFKAYEIEQIKALLEKYNGECLTYVLKGDLDAIFDRYIKREYSGDRHWIHAKAKGGKLKESDRDGFKETMYSRFGLEGAETGQTVTVDTTSFEKINYEDLFDIAKDFIK